MPRKISYVLLFFSILLYAGCTRDEDDSILIGQPQTGDNSEINQGTDGPNLLKNGGLEEWIGLPSYYYDSPSDWLCHNNNNVKKSHDIVYEGYYSAKMESEDSGASARIDQVVPVNQGGEIRIRFRYRVENWKENGARTYCYFRTGPAESTNISISDLRDFYSDEEYYIIRGGGRGIKYLPHSLNTWLVFDETIAVPPSATYFVFGVNSYYETTIYVDECYVGEISHLQ